MRFLVIQIDHNTLINALFESGRAWSEGKWQDPTKIKGGLRVETNPAERESFPRQHADYFSKGTERIGTPMRVLREADAWPIARANRIAAERQAAAQANSETAKRQRRDQNRKQAETLVCNWSALEMRTRMDKALADSLDRVNDGISIPTIPSITSLSAENAASAHRKQPPQHTVPEKNGSGRKHNLYQFNSVKGKGNDTQ